MATQEYQDYLYLIGKLKDIFKLDIDVDHENIHTFYKNKRPMFKLLFGMFPTETHSTIVVSFHIELTSPEAIQWFMNICGIHSDLTVHDPYIEDDNGETYLGEDAIRIQEVYRAQIILKQWLDNEAREDIEYFANSKVVGRHRDPLKSFNSQSERKEATIEFERIKKPGDDEQVH